MNKLLKIIRNCKHNQYGMIVCLLQKFNFIFPDKLYLQLMFRFIIKRKLNLNNPKTFNEKLQWLKLYNRNSLYPAIVDKYTAKEYVADVIGEEYVIPTLGTWNSVDEIDFERLPNQFVLKTTNGGGGCDVVVCKNKASFNKGVALSRLNKGLKGNIYRKFREWPYKSIKPRIIAEKYMEDESGALIDYKFSCFDGYVDCVMVCLDRHMNDTKFYFFDKNWNLKRLNIRGKNAPEGFSIPKPPCMDEMFDIASKLSIGFPFVRVDLYAVKGRVYFGEMTFYPCSGFDANLLPETDDYFGQLIDLNKIIRR